MPLPAMRSAVTTIQPVRCLSRMSAMNGANTDDIATMKAERAGVVYCSP